MLERIGRQRIENQLFIIYNIKCDLCNKIIGCTSYQYLDEEWCICPECRNLETLD